MSSEPARARGVLFVVSAPSGTGKTTVVERLVERVPGLRQSVSVTSRPARAGEADGVDYNFVSRDAFEALVREGAFLEWADIFDNLYGTSRTETERALNHGLDVVLVIDVQGARQVRERVAGAVAVFVLPPSYGVLAARLRGRNQDSAESMARRLETARREVAAMADYDYVVVNDDLDQCVGDLEAIVRAERMRLSRRLPTVESVVETFTAGRD